jgi:hypothetical protein
MKKNDLSKLKVRLPIIPGILGKEEHINASILIPFVLSIKNTTSCSKNAPQDIRKAGEICFPGGVYNPSTISRLRTRQYARPSKLGIPEAI